MYTKKDINRELYNALQASNGATGMRIENDAIRKLRRGLYRLSMKVMVVNRGIYSSFVDVVRK